MKLIKKIALWILFGFLAIIALAAMPSFASFAATAIGLIIMPIDKWQSIVQKFIKGKSKAITLTALTILMLFTFPKTDSVNDANIPDNTVPTSSAVATTETTIDFTTAATTETSPVATTAPTTEPTAEPTTAPATKPDTTPPPAPAPTPSTEPTQPPATNPPTPPATEPTPTATEPPHVHSYGAASCTTPATCSCGATEGAANGHSFSSGKCSVCGVADPNYTPETMVWIPTKGGTKYHSNSSCSNMENPEYVTKSTAIARGFDACKRCH